MKKQFLIWAVTTAMAVGTAFGQIPDIQFHNGKTIPQLGFGTWTLIETATPSGKAAAEAGFRMFDTAQGYQNEAAVYQGIVESGIPRSEVFITTKISPDNMRNRTVRESLDKSLADLGGEYIDLVLIHWPVKEHIRETWQIMEEYVDKGLVRSIGLSNFNPHHIDSLLEYARIKPVLNQIEIHPYFTQEDNVAYNRSKDIVVQGWSPLGSGTILDDETIAGVAQRYGKSPAQVIIRWHLQRGLVTIPRTDNPDYIAENINVFDFELSEEDMKLISNLNTNQRRDARNDPENFPW